MNSLECKLLIQYCKSKLCFLASIDFRAGQQQGLPWEACSTSIFIVTLLPIVARDAGEGAQKHMPYTSPIHCAIVQQSQKNGFTVHRCKTAVVSAVLETMFTVQEKNVTGSSCCMSFKKKEKKSTSRYQG